MARVLVIEDNETNMKLIKLILASAGHEVLHAEDAHAGIELARAHLPDVILMDVQLPTMDGLEATRRLKSEAVTAAIPVIAVTAYAMCDDAARMSAAGCDGYLAKPFRKGDLLSCIASAIAAEC